jgi:hypothetical protein
VSPQAGKTAQRKLINMDAPIHDVQKIILQDEASGEMRKKGLTPISAEQPPLRQKERTYRQLIGKSQPSTTQHPRNVTKNKENNEKISGTSRRVGGHNTAKHWATAGKCSRDSRIWGKESK